MTADIRTLLRTYVALLRAEQWLKNAFVFIALIFARRFTDGDAVVSVLVAAVVFCALASAMYITNDLHDVDEDRHHPQKRRRPIAAGLVAPRSARRVRAGLLVAALVGSAALGASFSLVAAAYIVLNVAYSYRLKRIALVDVMVIAAGYVLRVVGGAVAIPVPVTPWLLVTSMLLALFLALGKRRNELVVLGSEAATHRAALAQYTPELLDQLIAVVTSSTVIAYSLYAMDRAVAEQLGTPWLPLTIPLVLFGVFRYLYLIHRHQGGGDPTMALIRDRPLLASVALWSLFVVALIAS
ncbi:decaprenyl-phosphate phosphoribosyltransferase [Candidatus Uhrbacteria bacterium]|nr:decaprenyl-phosphate phosphoribosyltransferase [Candidatus Uhrbacteria bacterium]